MQSRFLVRFTVFGCQYQQTCNQKQEWYTGKTRMYDETHQIQIALITNCGLYTHGSLFGLLCLCVNINKCNVKQ